MRRKRRPRLRRRQGREVPLTPEMISAFEEQREAFRSKFGRDPGPDDPVFFDPDADTPVPLELTKLTDEVVKVMVETGIDPALIYAYRRTGLIVTEENEHLLTDEDRQAWRDALAEYEDMISREPM